MNNQKQNIYFPYMLASIPFMYISFILPMYCKDLGMDAVQFSGLYSVLSFIVLLTRPLIGKASDHVGRKPMFIGSLCLYCIAFYFLSIATNVWILYIARIIQAIASPILSISLSCMIIDTSDNSIGEAFGRLETSSTRGGIIGIVLAYIIFARFSSFMTGWKVFLYICGGAYFIAIIYIIKSIKETKTDKKIEKKKLKLTVNLKKLLVIEFILCCFSSLLFPLFMMYLIDKFSANVYEIGFAYMLPLLIDSILPKYIGKFSDKFNKTRLMTVALIIEGAVLLFFPSINNVYASAIAMCFINTFGTLYSTSSNVIFARETGNQNRGAIVGSYSTITGIGAVIGPIAGGILYKNISIAAPFYFSCIGYVAVAILIVVLFKNYKEEKYQA